MTLSPVPSETERPRHPHVRDRPMIEQLGAGAVGLGILIAGVFNGWQAVAAKREAKHARVEANRAAENAHPVSNGWGSKVAADLDYLRQSMDRMHHRQDTADQRATAADQRVTNLAVHVQSLATALQAHVADHPTTSRKANHDAA